MSEWISVEDRLPEARHHVLICYFPVFCENLKKQIDTGYYEEPEEYNDGGGWKFWLSDKVVRGGVTHWMPLPELPK